MRTTFLFRLAILFLLASVLPNANGQESLYTQDEQLQFYEFALQRLDSLAGAFADHPADAFAGVSLSGNVQVALEEATDWAILAYALTWKADFYAADMVENFAVIGRCALRDASGQADSLEMAFNFGIDLSGQTILRTIAAPESIRLDATQLNRDDELPRLRDAIEARPDSPLLKMALRKTEGHYRDLLRATEASIEAAQQANQRDEVSRLFERALDINKYGVKPFDRAAFQANEDRIYSLQDDWEDVLDQERLQREAEAEAAIERGFDLIACGMLPEGIGLLNLNGRGFMTSDQEEELEAWNRVDDMTVRPEDLAYNRATDNSMQEAVNDLPEAWQDYYFAKLAFAKYEYAREDGTKRRLLKSANVRVTEAIQKAGCFVPAMELRVEILQEYEKWFPDMWQDRLHDIGQDCKLICRHRPKDQALIAYAEAGWRMLRNELPQLGFNVLREAVDTSLVAAGDLGMHKHVENLIGRYLAFGKFEEAQSLLSDFEAALPGSRENKDVWAFKLAIALPAGKDATNAVITEMRAMIGAKSTEVLDQIASDITRQAEVLKDEGLHAAAFAKMNEVSLIASSNMDGSRMELLGDFAVRANEPQLADSIYRLALPQATDEERLQVKISKNLLRADLEVHNAEVLQGFAEAEKSRLETDLVFLWYLKEHRPSKRSKAYFKAIKKSALRNHPAELAEARYIVKGRNDSKAGLKALLRWEEEVDTPEANFEVACAYLGWHPTHERRFFLNDVPKGKVREAQLRFEKFAAERPNNWLVNRYLGYLSLGRGDLDAAAFFLNKARLIKPGMDLEMQLDLVNLRIALGEYDLAMKQWDSMEDNGLFLCSTSDEEWLAWRLLTKLVADNIGEPISKRDRRKGAIAIIDRSSIEPYRCERLQFERGENDGLLKTLVVLAYKKYVIDGPTAAEEKKFEAAVLRNNHDASAISLDLIASLPIFDHLMRDIDGFEAIWDKLEKQEAAKLKKKKK